MARVRPLLDRLRAEGESFDVGLRINPMHSEGEVAKYDPAAPCSRLGFTISQLLPEQMEGVDGVHMHSLCDQDFPPLHRPRKIGRASCRERGCTYVKNWVRTVS